MLKMAPSNEDPLLSQDRSHSLKIKDKGVISLLRFCTFCLFSYKCEMWIYLCWELFPFLSDCDIFLSHLSFFYRTGLTILIPLTTLLPAETCATSEKLFNLLLKHRIYSISTVLCHRYFFSINCHGVTFKGPVKRKLKQL